MKCPYCKPKDIGVTDTRGIVLTAPTFNTVRRQHKCRSCLKTWTTYKIKWDGDADMLKRLLEGEKEEVNDGVL